VSRKKREVRLSRPGKVFVGLTLALGFAAVNTGNNVLFLLVSMMLSIMVLSGFVALANIWRVSVVCIAGQILTENAAGDVLLRIHNPRPWPLWLLELRLGAIQQTVTRVGAREAALVALPWSPPCRGQPSLPPLQMGSAFPFSFVWRGIQLKVEANDYPWVAPAPELQEWTRVAAGQDTQHGQVPGGQGDFLWIRDYRPGEGLHNIVWRRVDWSQSGEGRLRLPSCEREQTEQQLLLLDWDAPIWQRFGVEPRLRAFRGLLDNACSQGRSWELRMPLAQLRGNGRFQRDAALLLLAQQTPIPIYIPDTSRHPGRLATWWHRYRRFLPGGRALSG